MLLTQRIEMTSFSPSEKEVIRYVLKHLDNLDHMTIREITEATYTSAPIVMRASKKLGLDGFSDLKEKLSEELEYIYASSEVDASIPFVVSDSYQDIANNITKLESKSIEDTLSLLSHDQLYQTISYLKKAKVIDIYANNSKTYLAQEFAYKMSFVQKQVYVSYLSGDSLLHASMSNENHVAIVISYSGETKRSIEICQLLKKTNTKIITITSLGNNTLELYADIKLNTSSKEMIHTKIGDFSSSSSIKVLLDIIYGCIFSLNYEENLDRKLQLAKMIQPYDPENHI